MQTQREGCAGLRISGHQPHRHPVMSVHECVSDRTSRDERNLLRYENIGGGVTLSK